MDKLEYRSFSGLTSQDSEADQPLRISGYFSVFNSESRDLGGFTEIIERGAFDSSLKSKNDIKALAFHDSNKVLGRLKNNTLSLRADDKGLYAEILLPNTQFARDLHKSIKDGYIDQASFGFKIKKRELRRDEETGDVRQIVKDLELIEISIVSVPAYESTEVSARCVEEFKKEIEAKKAEDEATEKAKRAVQMLKARFLLDDNG